MSNFNYYCKFNSTAAYSFGKQKKETKKETFGPGPLKYNTDNGFGRAKGIKFNRGNFKNLNFVSELGPGQYQSRIQSIDKKGVKFYHSKRFHSQQK